METDPKAQWKVSDDKLIMGKALPGVKGKFADLKLATLQDKNGKSTVVAKMNKGKYTLVRFLTVCLKCY